MSMDTELQSLCNALNTLSTHRVKRWFLPSALLDAAKKHEQIFFHDSAPVICAAFEKTWFFQRWFFACLAAFDKSITMKGYRLIKGVYLQKKRNGEKPSLTDLLFDTVDALEKLSHAGLLAGKKGKANSQALRDCVASGEIDLKTVLNILSEVGLLKGQRAQENLDSITCNTEGLKITHILTELSYTKLLNSADQQVNFDAVVNHPKKDNLLALIAGYRKNLLVDEDAQANFDALVKHETPSSLKLALDKISEQKSHPLRLKQYFHQLIQYSPVLFGSNTQLLWSVLKELITRVHVVQMLEICANSEASPLEERQDLLLTYVNETILKKPEVPARTEQASSSRFFEPGAPESQKTFSSSKTELGSVDI